MKSWGGKDGYKMENGEEEIGRDGHPNDQPARGERGGLHMSGNTK